jgi:hypothetical protein
MEKPRVGPGGTGCVFCGGESCYNKCPGHGCTHPDGLVHTPKDGKQPQGEIAVCEWDMGSVELRWHEFREKHPACP